MHPWNEPLFQDLKRRLDSLPHALLLHGPEGVGKLALAERVAQLVLCEAAAPAARPCGACDGCRWFLGGNHPDFRRLEPEILAKAPIEDNEEPQARRAKPSMDIKIDQVRALAGFLNLGSHRGRRRVALIYPADEITASAANALLKGLEEPPPAAMFLLVAHRPARLLPTIRSRCVALPVPVPAKEVALKWLSGQGTKNAERWLRYAGGAPLRALDYVARADALERLMRAVESREQIIVDEREELESLAEVLQRVALDRAMAAFGLPGKYGTPASSSGGQAKAWLAFARRMGQDRALTRHPLNPRLFTAQMFAGIPGDRT